MLPWSVLGEPDLTAGSPAENTALLLSLVSAGPPAPAIRPFGSAERRELLRAVLGHRRPEQDLPSTAVSWNAWADLEWNSSWPVPIRDGPVWRGRGVTGITGGGLTYSRGFLDVAIRPIAFWSQNQGFDPPVPRPPDDYRDPFWGHLIDRPYRFGGHDYSRIDPGESWVRLESHRVALAFSTAGQHWGPAQYFPLLMGTEAGGYPRVSMQLRSLRTPLGTATAEWSVGRLEASPFALEPPGSRSRVMPSLVASFVPAGMSGLEVGGARLFHVRWRAPAIGIKTALLPFKGLLKTGDPTGEQVSGDQNQIGTIFLKVAPPGKGIAVYGEYYREDHNVDVRDLVAEPDHQSGYTLGVRRVFEHGPSVAALTVEVMNSRISHLERVRGQAPLSTHGTIREGHTLRGQPLGSWAIAGGGGAAVVYERIDAASGMSIEGWMLRSTQNLEGGTWNGQFLNVYSLRLTRTALERIGGVFRWTVHVDYKPRMKQALNLGIGLSTTLGADRLVRSRP